MNAYDKRNNTRADRKSKEIQEKWLNQAKHSVLLQAGGRDD